MHSNIGGRWHVELVYFQFDVAIFFKQSEFDRVALEVTLIELVDSKRRIARITAFWRVLSSMMHA